MPVESCLHDMIGVLEQLISVHPHACLHSLHPRPLRWLIHAFVPMIYCGRSLDRTRLQGVRKHPLLLQVHCSMLSAMTFLGVYELEPFQ